jgi:hypothetical protein
MGQGASLIRPLQSGGLDVNDQLDVGGLFHRQICGLSALEHFRPL